MLWMDSSGAPPPLGSRRPELRVTQGAGVRLIAHCRSLRPVSASVGPSRQSVKMSARANSRVPNLASRVSRVLRSPNRTTWRSVVDAGSRRSARSTSSRAEAVTARCVMGESPISRSAPGITRYWSTGRRLWRIPLMPHLLATRSHEPVTSPSRSKPVCAMTLAVVPLPLIPWDQPVTRTPVTGLKVSQSLRTKVRLMPK